MSNTVNSPYMSLPVPVVGTDPGPNYAIDINACLAIVDQHNHTPGQGTAITPAAMNINADLTFNNNNATNFKAVRFQPQSSPIPATGVQLGQLYEAGVDLYYNDGAGNQIRMTASGAVAGTPGSISNLVPPASASYNAINGTFVWQSAANTPANMDAASYILRNFTANSKGLTLSPPAAMGADFAITLPALPGSNLPVSIDNTGLMTAARLTLAQVPASLSTAPTVQIFTAAGAGSYATPTNPAPLYIEIEAVGGGGGGAGGSNGGSVGGNGTSTTFSTFITAGAGAGGDTAATNTVGAGGGYSISGPAFDIGSENGGQGGAPGGANGGQSLSGAMGGVSFFGGGGGGGGGNSSVAGAGGNAAANTGSGGGGGGSGAGQFGGGGGGGAGAYVKAQVNSPSGSYALFIGSGGGGGAGGPNSGSGGTAADGKVIVREFYGA